MPPAFAMKSGTATIPRRCELLDRARAVRDVRARGDDRAAQARGDVARDRVRPRAGHEHVALQVEQLLARADGRRPVRHERVAEPLAQGEQLVDVEAVRIGEQPVDRAHADDPGARAHAGERHPGTDLAEALDGDRRARQRAAAVDERGLRGRLDAVSRGEVVHVDTLVALRPQRRRTLQRLP